MATGIYQVLRTRDAAPKKRQPGNRVAVLAEGLSQPLCAIRANVDAMARLLERDVPDLDEIRAALVDLAHDTDRACDLLRAAQRAEPGARTTRA